MSVVLWRRRWESGSRLLDAVLGACLHGAGSMSIYSLKSLVDMSYMYPRSCLYRELGDTLTWLGWSWSRTKCDYMRRDGRNGSNYVLAKIGVRHVAP